MGTNTNDSSATPGSPRFARQRYNVANPYKAPNAKPLLFYLFNYATNQGYYFPPYIQSYSDSYGANWNTVNFLGRPEPVYTYNNSTREGTISFIILTDYTQNITIGTDYTKDSLTPVTVNPRVGFTSEDTALNNETNIAAGSVASSTATQQTNNKAIQQLNAKKNQILSSNNNTTTPDTAEIDNQIANLQSQSNNLSTNQAGNQQLLARNTNLNGIQSTQYSEASSVIGNINNFMMYTQDRDSMGNIDSKAVKTQDRINQMIQNLMFQPAFFSGDKTDFVTKTEFVAKLTRPASAYSGSGFSFTNPPVAAIKLGDWWSNDIVVDSVNFNYDGVPWSLDGDGRNQPMWVVVNMNFKFIGPYGGQSGGPVLADDIGGFYQQRGGSMPAGA